MRPHRAITQTAALISSLLFTAIYAADSPTPKAKVTGIGGVFFLAQEDHKALSAWYQEHLGIPIQDWGGGLIFWKGDTASDGGLTVWHAAEKDSDWFAPSKSRFMINYRVDDLEKMIEQLESAGIEIIKGPEYHENGIFAWIMDPQGNKIELWEPMLWDPKNKR